jgi:hypothetical protein
MGRGPDSGTLSPSPTNHSEIGPERLSARRMWINRHLMSETAMEATKSIRFTDGYWRVSVPLKLVEGSEPELYVTSEIVICEAPGLVEAVRFIEGLFGTVEESLRLIPVPLIVPPSGAVPKPLADGNITVPETGNCPDELGVAD